MNRWQKVVRAARADSILPALVRAVVAANRVGEPDRVAYYAFRDRVDELGLYIPNPAYYRILFFSLTA